MLLCRFNRLLLSENLDKPHNLVWDAMKRFNWRASSQVYENICTCLYQLRKYYLQLFQCTSLTWIYFNHNLPSILDGIIFGSSYYYRKNRREREMARSNYWLNVLPSVLSLKKHKTQCKQKADRALIYEYSYSFPLHFKFPTKTNHLEVSEICENLKCFFTRTIAIFIIKKKYHRNILHVQRFFFL